MSLCSPSIGKVLLDLAVDMAKELDVAHRRLRTILREEREEAALELGLARGEADRLVEVRPLRADRVHEPLHPPRRLRLERGQPQRCAVDALEAAQLQGGLEKLGGGAAAEPAVEGDAVVEEEAASVRYCRLCSSNCAWKTRSRSRSRSRLASSRARLASSIASCAFRASASACAASALYFCASAACTSAFVAITRPP